MVDPSVLGTYWSEILLLAAVVIVGMILFGTLGMLLTGQTLRVAMQSGFSLTQIGEFSFIIASLGMSLGVLTPSLYPIIVAVSVITIFTTPYFIKMADPAYNFVERHLPGPLQFLINRYSTQVSDANETRRLWKDIISRYLWRVVLYSVILVAIILVSRQFLFPMLEGFSAEWGRLIATIATLVAMSPFLVALSFSSTKPDERMKLHATASFYDVPLMTMRIVRYIITLLFIVYFISLAYTALTAWIIGTVSFVLIIVFASTRLLHRYRNIEKKFMDNLNFRENVRSGKNNNLVSDLHQAYVEVGADCRYAGDRLRDSGWRSDFGVSISSIRRGDHLMPLPSGDTRIFPGDIIGVIGTDDQIKRLNESLSGPGSHGASAPSRQPAVELKSILLTDRSPVVGKPLAETDIRGDYYSMIIKIKRGEEDFFNPTPETVLQPGDIVWVVGDPERFDKMK